MSEKQTRDKSLMKFRDRAIRKEHMRIIAESGINKRYLTRDFIVKQIEKCTAPRFYMCEEKARLYVLSYLNGKMHLKTKLKQAMVLDLVEAYKEIIEKYPNATKFDIWYKVVRHPAKSFYISPSRIIEVVYQYHDRK